MTLFAALDVALEKTALCVVDRDGTILVETTVPTDPEAIAGRLMPFLPTLGRLGLEAGPLSEWLVRGLAARGLTAVLMETRHVRAALSAPRHQDRPQRCTRHGRPSAHGVVPARPRQEHGFPRASRASDRPIDVDATSQGYREQRAGASARLRHPPKQRCCGRNGTPRSGMPSPAIRYCRPSSSLCFRPAWLYVPRVAVVDKRVRDAARDDAVCRRLMTTPGVGPIVALTYRAAVDEPERFRSSKAVGASFGLDTAPLPIRRDGSGRGHQPGRRPFRARRLV